MSFELGDVFLTRNLNEEDNTSPGYWNHTAIYIGGNIIVEAQSDPSVIPELRRRNQRPPCQPLTTEQSGAFDEGQVIRSDLFEFTTRYPEILVLRLDSENIAVKMAKEAQQLIGTRYRKIASVFKFLRKDRRGHNCVSVVRSSYEKATGENEVWRTPDDILNSGMFTVVSRTK